MANYVIDSEKLKAKIEPKTVCPKLQILLDGFSIKLCDSVEIERGMLSCGTLVLAGDKTLISIGTILSSYVEKEIEVNLVLLTEKPNEKHEAVVLFDGTIKFDKTYITKYKIYSIETWLNFDIIEERD
ncbi:MAG: hypothetical protein DRH90_21585 [Deltaproteobacteria bacterium]|nr:MAG: hypothetical protein DRH90_21585 [Deltaproteobacteria bacterium]